MNSSLVRESALPSPVVEATTEKQAVHQGNTKTPMTSVYTGVPAKEQNLLPVYGVETSGYSGSFPFFPSSTEQDKLLKENGKA